jgi:hypothetical protein
MAQLKLRNAPLYVGALNPGQLKLRNAPVYVAIQSMPTIDIRNVRAFALTQPAVDVTLRKVRAYALVHPSPVTYLSMKADVALLTAVNKEHGKNFTESQVFFENPRALAGDARYNSKVSMKPQPTYPYSGSMEFRYNRWPIADAFQGLDTSTLPAGNQTTVHARLAAINAAFGRNFATYDVVNSPVAANATAVTLTVASTSFLFTPGTSITIGSSLPANDLSIKAPVTDLGGFDAEG